MLLLTQSIITHAKDIDQIAKETIPDNEAVKVYAGKVGKLPAIFMIEWGSEQIFGNYFHPSKGRANSYQLKGTNPKTGVLILREYSSKNEKKILTANIKPSCNQV